MRTVSIPIATLFLAATAIAGVDVVRDLNIARSSGSLKKMLEAKKSAKAEFDRRATALKKAGREVNKRNAGINPSYLDAYIYEVQRAGYPNDRIDPEMYERGRQHVAQMGSTMEDVERRGNWFYRGPHNLDVPYSQYWGPKPVSGRVNAVLYDWADPSNDYFIGTAGGGVWKTTNGGVDWTPISDRWDNLSVSSLAMHPTNNQIIFAGTGDAPGGTPGIGILKSTDDGASFKAVAGDFRSGCAVNRILIDPEQPSVMLATASATPGGANGGVYRSTDNGENWILLGGVQGLPVTNYMSASFSAADSTGSRRYWVTTRTSPPRSFTSTNRGATWSEVTIPAATTGSGMADIAASPTSRDRAYLLLNNERRIQRTTDGGATWSSIKGTFPNGTDNYNWSQNSYDWHITATKRTPSSTSDALYVGLIDLAVSLNADSTWRSIGGPTYDLFGAKTHNDQHCMTPNPNDPTELLVGNDGGVYKVRINRSTGEATYTNLNRTLGITQLYYASWAKNNRNRILSGAQDNATPVSADDLSNWKAPVGGDGTGVSILQSNYDRQYATNQNLGLNDDGTEIGVYLTQHNWFFPPRRVSTGVTSAEVSDGHVPFVGPVTTSEDADHAYIGTNKLYRWEDNLAGGWWVPRLGGRTFCSSSNTFITAIAVPKGQNRIYVGTLDGRLWYSTIAGTIWFEVITLGLPNRPITSITSNPSNVNEVLVTIGGAAGQGRVWENVNVTSATSPWQNRSGTSGDSLPDVPTNCLVRDLNAPSSSWFVGNDLGVFFTNDGGFSYYNMTRPYGLPQVRVTSLGWNTEAGDLRLNCSTFGRGIWRISVANGDPIIGDVTAPASLVGGQEQLCFVEFSAPAPSGGITVTFASSNTSALTVPASVNVGAGITGCFFRVRTSAVASNTMVTVDINAAGDKREVPILVKNTMIHSLEVLDHEEGAKEIPVIVKLIGPAPATGYRVQVGYESATGDIVRDVAFSSGQQAAKHFIELPAVDKKTEVKLIAKWRNMQEVVRVLHRSPKP